MGALPATLISMIAQGVAAGDHRLMHHVNHWCPPRWLRLWMLTATRCGDGWLWYAVGAIVALYGGPHRWEALAASTLAVAVGVVLFLKLKRICNRKRPCALEPNCWASL